MEDNRKEKRYKVMGGRVFKLTPPHLPRCHMLGYEHTLLHVILSSSHSEEGCHPPSPTAPPPPMQGFAHTLLITLSERGCMNWPKELPKPGAGSRGGGGGGRGECEDGEGGLHELAQGAA